MLLEFWTWWYGVGWADISQRVGARVVGVWQLFSIDILLRTLFSPWKRIVAAPGKSLDAIFRSMIDNTVSRFVGFFARIFVLFAALILTSLAAIIGLIMVLFWPLLPLAVIYALYRGIAP